MGLRASFPAIAAFVTKLTAALLALFAAWMSWMAVVYNGDLPVVLLVTGGCLITAWGAWRRKRAALSVLAGLSVFGALFGMFGFVNPYTVRPGEIWTDTDIAVHVALSIASAAYGVFAAYCVGHVRDNQSLETR